MGGFMVAHYLHLQSPYPTKCLQQENAAGGRITRLPHWLSGALLHNVPYQALR